MESDQAAQLKMETSLAHKNNGKQTTKDRGHPQQLLDESPISEPEPEPELEHERYVEYWPLSGKPYFYIILKHGNLAKKFRLTIPNRISKNLPNARVPARIFCRGKVWDMDYLGNHQAPNKTFENRTWGIFVEDNNLAVGDACVFELMEGDSNSTSIQFKVQILKDDFPTELLEKAEGYTMNNPIYID